MPISDADIETPWRNLARAVIGKAISDFCLSPTSKERKALREEAELFLFPNEIAYRRMLHKWLNLAGIDSAWFEDEFSPRLYDERDETLWSGTSF